jgi:hypothetical protein
MLPKRREAMAKRKLLLQSFTHEANGQDYLEVAWPLDANQWEADRIELGWKAANCLLGENTGRKGGRLLEWSGRRGVVANKALKAVEGGWDR